MSNLDRTGQLLDRTPEIIDLSSSEMQGIYPAAETNVKSTPNKEIHVSENKEFEFGDEIELNSSHSELIVLIDAYDQNLHDRKIRAEIEAEAVKVAESYKREVLAKVKRERKEPTR